MLVLVLRLVLMLIVGVGVGVGHATAGVGDVGRVCDCGGGSLKRWCLSSLWCWCWWQYIERLKSKPQFMNVFNVSTTHYKKINQVVFVIILFNVISFRSAQGVRRLRRR